MKLFNTEIPIKVNACSLNNIYPTLPNDPYVNIYLKLTDRCNANCDFCTFKSSEPDNLDLYKFYYTLAHIKKTVKITKVSITGGEPTLALPNLIKAVEMIKEIDDSIFIVLNTNGTKLKELPEATLKNINSIALSRHHYDEDINRIIYNVKQPLFSLEDIKAFPYKDKLHLSCNLIKGYIDSKESVYYYIKTLAKLGVSDFGFVSLMDVNNFAKVNFVDFKDIPLTEMQNTIVNKQWKYGEDCRCNNYLTFTEEGSIVKLYARFYVNRDKCESTLVYDRNCLKIGFSGKQIFTEKDII